MYPVWYVPYLTSGWIIGIIATLHILPSHLSTSAMWFNVYIEWKAYKENRPELLKFVKKFTLSLLVFAYVFGSLSGIGIWFATMASSPRGISGLIHNYVWGWATEWVFFIIEVLGIFVYYYTFEKVDKRTHLILGLIFALGSWITMAIIVGILAFMLSPGKWVENGNFFYGFFNQTYFPQLFLRTALMFSITALYAILISSTLKDKNIKKEISKKAGFLGLISLIISIPFIIIYLKTIPHYSREAYSLLVTKGLKLGFFIPLIITFLFFLLNIFKPTIFNSVTSVTMFIIFFLSVFAGERIREILRKPYVIPEYMYSNQIIAKDHKAKGVKSDYSKIDGKGFLNLYPFTPPGLKEIKDSNRIKAGKLLALLQCSSCHALENKGIRPLPKMVERMGIDDIETMIEFLEGMGEMYSYMPPFIGNEKEKEALASYLISLKRR